jgi:hypothetical protein
LNVPAGVSHGCEGRACSKPAAGDIPKLSIHLYTKQRKEIAPRIVAFERAKSLRRKERRNGRFCFTTTRSGQQQSERNAQQESHRHLIAWLGCRLHATAHGEYCARLCNVDHRNDGVLLPPLSACNGTAAQPCASAVLPALRCLFCDGHCMCCVAVWCCGMSGSGRVDGCVSNKPRGDRARTRLPADHRAGADAGDVHADLRNRHDQLSTGMLN